MMRAPIITTFEDDVIRITYTANDRHFSDHVTLGFHLDSRVKTTCLIMTIFHKLKYNVTDYTIFHCQYALILSLALFNTILERIKE